LADSLRYIVSQRLAQKIGGGRQLLTEIMGHNLRTQEAVAIGEGDTAASTKSLKPVRRLAG